MFNFLNPYFYKSLDPIGSIFFRVLYPGTEKLMKYPPLWVWGANVLKKRIENKDLIMK